MTQTTSPNQSPFFFRALGWGIFASTIGGFVYAAIVLSIDSVRKIDPFTFPKAAEQIVAGVLAGFFFGTLEGIILGILPAACNALVLTILVSRHWLKPHANRKPYLIVCFTSAAIATIGVLVQLGRTLKMEDPLFNPYLIAFIATIGGWWVAHHLFRDWHLLLQQEHSRVTTRP